MKRIACVIACVTALALGWHSSPSSAETVAPKPFSRPLDHWPLDYQCPGNVIVGKVPDLNRLRSALSDKERSARIGIVVDRDVSESDWLELTQIFAPAIEVRIARADLNNQLDQLADCFETCDTIVWWSKKETSSVLLDSLPRYREGLRSFLSRQGTLVALGSPASLVGDHCPVTVDKEVQVAEEIQVAPGLGAFPGTLIQIKEDPAVENALDDPLSKLPGVVGITMKEETMMGRRGRIVFPVGDDAAIFLHLPAGQLPHDIERPSQTVRYPKDPSSGNRIRSRQANDYLADLTQWRRRAIDLHLPIFPAAEPPQPIVPNGTLVIVGGGGTPKGLMQQFVDFAGGAETAKLVYVPCTEEEEVSPNQSTLRQWKRMGVQHAVVLHTKDRLQADNDEAFLAPLRDATGIWFGGGRQWNFADSYHGTQAHTLMQEVLQAGGVIGGSSAGASIQADFLARATPIENFDIVAPGYIRGGLGFLPGVAIDQHFSQRQRQSDMSGLIRMYPQVLGIGIDETTAIIVQKSQAKVVGRGDVYFYDADANLAEDYQRLSAGECYDLVERKPCETK